MRGAKGSWLAVLMVLALGCRDEAPATQADGTTGVSESSSGSTGAESTGSLDTTTGLDTTAGSDEDSSSSGDGVECEPMPPGTSDAAWFMVATFDAVLRIDSHGDLPLEPVEVATPPAEQLFVGDFHHDSAIVLRSWGVGDDSLWFGSLEDPGTFSLHKLDIAPAPDAESRHAAFSPDGSQVLFDAAATVGGSRALYLTSVDGSPPSLFFEPSDPSATLELDFEFTPDGGSVVFVADLDGTGQLRRYQLPSTAAPGTVPRDLGPRTPDEFHRGYAADGSYMVMVRDAGLHRIDLTGVGPTEPQLIFGPPSEGEDLDFSHFAGSRDWAIVEVDDGRETTPHAINLSEAEPNSVVLPTTRGVERVSPGESYYAYLDEDFEPLIADMRQWPPILVDLSLPSLPAGHRRRSAMFTDDDTLYVVDHDQLYISHWLHRLTLEPGGRSHSEFVLQWEGGRGDLPHTLVDERILLFSDVSQESVMDIECPTAPVSFADGLDTGIFFGVRHEPPSAKVLAFQIVLDRQQELDSYHLYEFDTRRDPLGTVHELVELDSWPVWWAQLPATAPGR
ncbi:MAG: hypothetical protein AAF799_35235 [Myxococcota bacterium]